VARLREEESAFRREIRKELDNSEDLGINARILKWILMQHDGRTTVKFVWRI
jgi:hypothetical protein